MTIIFPVFTGIVLWMSGMVENTGQDIGGRFSIEDLRWLAGSWVDEEGPVFSEEHWLPPRGAVMLGIHRAVFRPEERAFFEYLRIEQIGDRVIYYARPDGEKETPFYLTSIIGGKASFENEQHDYPTRITYWKDKSGFLNARIEGTVDGKDKFDVWRWKPLFSTVP